MTVGLEGFIATLLELIESPAARAELADSRFACTSDFDAVVRVELALALRWAVARARLARATSTASNCVILMPRWAGVLHALRRAVPFAARGIPTVAWWPTEAEAEAQAATALIKRLDLPISIRVGLPTAATQPTPSLVVLTGRQRSARTVAESCSAPVVAACGRCSLIVTEGLRPSRRDRQPWLSRSCTNLRGSFSLVDDMLVGRRGNRWPVATVLQRTHPSIVWWHGSAPPPRQLTDTGYFIADASTGNPVAGAFADPIYGWPGDWTDLDPDHLALTAAIR